MKAPRCRVCQEEHWPREAHVFPAAPSSATSEEAERGASNPPQADGAASNGASNARGPKQRWERAKYNAYQRDLMRARRAAARAAGSVNGHEGR